MKDKFARSLITSTLSVILLGVIVAFWFESPEMSLGGRIIATGVATTIYCAIVVFAIWEAGE
jgi:hypothetical protein